MLFEVAAGEVPGQDDRALYVDVGDADRQVDPTAFAVFGGAVGDEIGGAGQQVCFDAAWNQLLANPLYIALMEEAA